MVMVSLAPLTAYEAELSAQPARIQTAKNSEILRMASWSPFERFKFAVANAIVCHFRSCWRSLTLSGLNPTNLNRHVPAHITGRCLPHCRWLLDRPTWHA